jgi:hypothetical protein
MKSKEDPRKIPKWKRAAEIARRFPKWNLAVAAIVQSGLADSIPEADELLYEADQMESL